LLHLNEIYAHVLKKTSENKDKIHCIEYLSVPDIIKQQLISIFFLELHQHNVHFMWSCSVRTFWSDLEFSSCQCSAANSKI
jgi:hypothetical protein